MAQTISVSHKNDLVKLHYWPNADGQRYNGYVTNLKQIFEQLRRKGLKNKFNLYNLNRKPIISDRHFKEELNNVPPGEALQLFAHELNQVPPRRKIQGKRTNETAPKKQLPQQQKSRKAGPIQKAVRFKLPAVTRLDSECCHCVQHPIVGRSYTNVRSKNTSYFLCYLCYERLQAEDKRNWQVVRKVASRHLPRPKSPPPVPILRQHPRPAIAFLPILHQEK